MSSLSPTVLPQRATSPDWPAALSYAPQLDGLRACAVMAVMVFHTLRPIMPGGFLGVDIFFVLSGYLITRTLLSDIERYGRIRFGRFYARRALRLLPALFLLLAVFWIAYCVFARLRYDVIYTPTETLIAIAATLTYVMNVLHAFGITDPGAFAHTWSLSIEEQFYLVWPVLLWALLSRFGRDGAVAAAAGLALAVLAWRFWLVHENVPVGRIYAMTDTRCDALLFGALAALAPVRPLSMSMIRLTAFPALLLLVLIARKSFTETNQTPILFTLVALASAWCVLVLAEGPEDFWLSRLLRNPVAVYLGTLSYGLYLWQWPVLYFLHILEIPEATFTQFVLVLTISLFFSALSYHAVERPLMRRYKPVLS
jgi:peptidoglycan/LPS O-acetylase OafA/YrhL